MPNYDLNRLGDKEFERLSQSLLKEIIGNGTITFGEGPDGGREATFSGVAPYPSAQQSWNGEWIFQVKFHDIQRIGPDEARKSILSELKSELDKIINKYNHKCENYILITNVPLSSVHLRGTHDQIKSEVLPAYKDKIKNMHVWGYDDICRFLEKYANVRQSYLGLITPGDMIANLIDNQANKTKNMTQAIHAYMTTSFSRERYAQLDQAGQVEGKKRSLKDVFIDLEAEFIFDKDEKLFKYSNTDIGYQNNKFSAVEMVLSEKYLNLVIIGGPGEGKSTIVQYLSQVHRATLLHRKSELALSKLDITPLVARIPFKVILKDYAQWLDGAGKRNSLDIYLSEQIQELSNLPISPQDIQTIFANNPCLLILDGLDEVTDLVIQDKMLERVSEFLELCEHIYKSNLQVVATSRPNSYTNQFDTDRFTHVKLVYLDSKKVLEYTENWTHIKDVDYIHAKRLKKTIQECLDDSQLNLLMNTPLQVTILILIILSGGTPPRQREALFNEYLEVIYKRESAKNTIVSSKQEIFELHEYLGYILQLRSSSAQDINSLLSKEEFIKEVRRFLSYNDPYLKAEILNKKVMKIVKEAEQRFVLITGIESGNFGFELRSIQEFFAAAYLANAPQDDVRYARFKAIAKLNHWRNVALFFAGRIGRLRSAEAANIITMCRQIDREVPDKILRRGTYLSLELAIDRSFGHKRTLQHEVIEYGLTLLQLGRAQFLPIKEMLSKLPEEDVKDLVLPLLEEKFSIASLRDKEVILNIYFSLISSKHSILCVLQDLFCDSEKESILVAIRKCAEWQIDVRWVNSQIKKYAQEVTVREILEVFQRTIMLKTAYIQDCLKDIDISVEDVYFIFDSLMSIESISYPMFPVLVPIEKIGTSRLNLSSVTDQFYFTLYSMAYIVAAFSRKSDYDSKDFLQLKNLFMQNAIQAIHSDDFYIPQLKATLWTVILTHKICTPKALNDFISFYLSHKSWESAVKIIKMLSGRSNPFIRGLLYTIDTNDYYNLDTLSNSVWSHENEFDYFSLYNKFMQNFGITDRANLELISGVGVVGIANMEERKAFSDSFEQIFGLTSQCIPELFSYTRFLQNIDLGPEQIVYVLDIIKSGLNNRTKIQSNWEIFIKIKGEPWPNDPLVVSNMQDLLNKLIEHKPLNLYPLQWVVEVFLKLYDVANPTDESIRSFLKLVANENLNIRLVSINKNYFSIITDLLKFLNVEDKTMQLGSTKMINIVVDAFYFSKTRVGRNIDTINDKLIPFELENVRQLIESKTLLKKIAGINLTLFTEFCTFEFLQSYLKKIISCNTKQEGFAWRKIIKYARYNKDQENDFKKLLESILTKKEKILPTIYTATFLRYQKVCSLTENATNLDSNQLMLPFNKE